MGLSRKAIIQGVAVHNDLSGRSLADSHPMSAISGLETALTSVSQSASSAVAKANTANQTATEAATDADTALAAVDILANDLGDKAALMTTNKSSFVAALNENFTNANNGKSLIASAIIGKGGAADAGETFAELANDISEIPNITNSTGNASEGDVLSPKTFSNDSGVNKVGTMANRAGDTAAISSIVAGNVLKLLASKGYRDGVDDYVTITDTDFDEANIKEGINLFGKVGTCKPIKIASGRTLAVAQGGAGYPGTFIISGLGFRPKAIIFNSGYNKTAAGYYLENSASYNSSSGTSFNYDSLEVSTGSTTSQPNPVTAVTDDGFTAVFKYVSTSSGDTFGLDWVAIGW